MPTEPLDVFMAVLGAVVCVLALLFLARNAVAEFRRELRYQRAWRDVEKRR